MTPPTIPPQIPDDAQEIAHIIIEALRNRNYDAGLSCLGDTWQEFDIKPMPNKITIGSKVRNRSYLHATWDKRIIYLNIFGVRPSLYGELKYIDPYRPEGFNLADPTSLDKIVDHIIKISENDYYQFPWL